MPLAPGKKRILGLRLSFLSESEAVRQTILDRLQAGEDTRAIMRDLTVTLNPGEVHFDLLADERDQFVVKLNTLLPDPPPGGDRYANEVGDDDVSESRQHDWDVWDQHLSSDPALRQQLREAILEVLGHNQKISVYGELRDQMGVDARNSGDPHLVFQITSEYAAQD